ncbi:hypothetical protein HII31_05049 [Pseudocercospora fuligena]|uniref:DUF1760-domain-containing protein n=1 Tax=Pseudocercospora fuligena TaxID=685502 RepID=A0A8H6VJ63_9PEZI|nr:hypothetical protein HII31_05049 [Pseudocercospora fuligena]
MAEEESPLIKALPPETDYWTYLTIVEYNLKSENLPILHKVLQDETLTTNIGWDLVHLLVPHLPDSEQCLQDIARLGNPREVILKVTESLRLIEYDQVEHEENEDEDATAESSDARKRADSNTYPLKTAPPEDGSAPKQAVEVPEPLPLPVQQFVALLSMLAILQTRIKTKFPSRFLSTTLQAILASFSNSHEYREEMIQAIVKTVKAVSGIARPTLPSRKSSGMLGSNAMAKAQSAADPEGPAVVESDAEESAMQKKLVQAFITHVIEEYMLNFPTYDNVPGMAWCSRIMEQLHPERTVPETKKFLNRFEDEETLHRRIDAIGQLVTLAQDLKISNEELQEAAITVEKVSSQAQAEDEPPTSADDIPLSRLGSLLLYTARHVSSVLYHRPLDAVPPFQLFPDHQELMKHCLASHDMGNGQLGTEPEALIDAILALGLLSLEQDSIGDPATDEQFNEYLQTVALLSSNCPNANLRGHAHYLTSTVLRSQPDEEVRLAFVRDTLEHCPFENLKVSAVGWIKGETIEANPPNHDHDHEQGQNGSGDSLFAKAHALESLAPYLFPELHTDLVVAPIQDAWTTFQTNISFYLASLNFLYLLLCAKHLHQKLEIPELWNNNDIAGSFIQPLRDTKARFSKEMEDGGALASEKSDAVLAEAKLLEETVERVTRAVPLLNET